MLVKKGRIRMKKSYSSPLVMVEEFTPNEYVAACGDVNYKFTCDENAGFWQGRRIYYYPVGDGVLDGVYKGKGKAEEFDTFLGGIHTCKATTEHIVDSDGEIYEGYLKGTLTGYNYGSIFLWLEKNDRGQVVNAHLSKNLIKESVARS